LEEEIPELETQLLDGYYKFKGWNHEGIPTKESLHALGLDYVAGGLPEEGHLDGQRKHSLQGEFRGNKKGIR